MKITFEELTGSLAEILVQEGLGENSAKTAAIFAQSSLDGYHSHGVNRFAEFVKNIRKGVIDPGKQPIRTDVLGPIERWNGQKGPGPLNASLSMDRAIALAKKNTLGCVALSNSNHWMRGGSYGWQAAEAGCMAICFTNTMPNMPPWGGKSPTTGNNPIIIAIPRASGNVVLDMSLSQFSYGKMYQTRLAGKDLPFAGGYDEEGNLTKDPGAIIESRRILQTGYWKGSGLSLMIDMLATLLTAGKSTSEIGLLNAESELSQVFLCIDPLKLNGEDQHETWCNQIIDHFQSADRVDPDQGIQYPGEATHKRRKRNLEDGISINDEIWNGILALKQ